MNDDPAMVDVLYIPVGEGPGKQALLKLCRTLIDSMIASQLLTRDEAEAQWLLDVDGNLSIKLHATIVNTKHSSARSNSRPSFDARPLLKRLNGRHIASVPLHELHLSIMGGGQDETSGYYRSEHILSLLHG